MIYCRFQNVTLILLQLVGIGQRVIPVKNIPRANMIERVWENSGV